MATTRTYGDRCGIARALDVVGERWSLLIVRELLLGPKRFTDLRDGLPGASHNVLSHRLGELEAAGVIERRTLPRPAPARVYALTARGADLEAVVLALGRWGAQTPVPPPEVPIGSTDAALLSLRTLYDGAAPAMTVALEVDGQGFVARTGGSHLDLSRGEAPGADARLACDAGTLIRLIRGRVELDEADATVSGSRRALARFLRSFPLVLAEDVVAADALDAL